MSINKYNEKECFFLSVANNGESVYQDNNNHFLIRRSFPNINESDKTKQEYSEIISDLEIIGSGLYDASKIDFNKKDIFIMNISSLIIEGFDKIIDYNHSDVVSVLIGSLKETTEFIINIFKNFMQNSNKIRIVCFSKRNNNIKDKSYNYLTKLFFEKDNKPYMAKVFNDYLKNEKYDFKLKINDLNKNLNNLLEKGVKKNNWKSINNDLINLTV